jgi:hypothetical protein
LSAGQKISVPLVPVDTSQGTELQRQWAAVRAAFQPTLVLDEALSILIGLCLVETDELASQEKRWIAEHEGEIPGFTTFYSALRQAVKIEGIITEAQALIAAEKVLQLGKKVLNSFSLQGWDEVFDRGPESVPELVQALIASAAFAEEDDKSFTRRDSTWREFVNFEFTTRDGITYLRAEPTKTFFDFVSTIRWPGDFPLDASNYWVMVQHCILIESIRQQICQGVGLRCPFWNGECCQSRGFPKGFKELLEKTYKITKPYKWHQHWQPLPCLG